MGIRGLATFISSNASEYLQTHSLHECTLVVDGNSLASQLYVHSSKSNSAFGGDYDRLGRCVRDFFGALSACGVEALVLFDGGYHARKLPTMWHRLKGKIYACSKVNPANQTRKNVFPLLLRETFKLVLSELGVQMAQCDFEADEEIAALSRTLQCPVLSLDSDFFVLDVLYVPFDQLLVTKDKGAKSLGCRIYRLQRFLDMFGGLQPEMLPLMATLLGNDYVNRKHFDPFFAQIRKLGSRRLPEQQRKIAGLLQWLRKETPDSALHKVLHFIRLEQRDRVRVAIDRATRAYMVPACVMDKYFDLSKTKSTILQSTKSKVPPEEDADSEEGEMDSAEEGKDSEEEDMDVEELETVDSDGKVPDFLPSFFVEAFRRCQMPPVFMDLCTFHIYIMQPQKEDFSERESASAISLQIIRMVSTIVLGPKLASTVLLVTRRFNSPVKEPLFKEGLLPPGDAPPLCSIPSMTLEERRILMVRVVGVDPDLLDGLPSEWHLFFLATLHWAKQSQFPVTDRQVHAVVLGLLLQAVVVPVKKGENLTALLSSSSGEPKHLLANLKAAECRQLFGEVYSANSFSRSTGKGTYDPGLVHNLAQLQSLILGLHQLNQLLLQPFRPTPMHRLYSGTLMYNVANSLQSRHDPMAYVRTCLQKGPTLFNLHFHLVTLILTFAPETKKIVSRKKKHKRPDRKVPAADSGCFEKTLEDSAESGCEEMTDWDANNRFALLRSN